MPKKKDITGKRFSKLVAIKMSDVRKGPSQTWECLCDCGNTVIANVSSLQNGYRKSCGCLRSEDITGKKYGRITVLERTDKFQNHHSIWVCKCECGNIKEISKNSLTSGNTVSCGCFHKEQLVISADKHLNKILTTEEFIKKSKKAHGDRYDYTKSIYHRSTDKIIIICKIHGEFTQNASSHIQGKGCFKCRSSWGENRIRLILEKNKINHCSEVSVDGCKNKRLLKFDFGILDENNKIIGLIEYNGFQHYEPSKWSSNDQNSEKRFELIKKRDLIKINYCEYNNIPLLTIPYIESKYIKNKISNFIKITLNIDIEILDTE